MPKIFLIYVLVFDPIKIQTSQALQNNRQNLSFLKDINVVGKKIKAYSKRIYNNFVEMIEYIKDILINQLTLLNDKLSFNLTDLTPILTKKIPN